MHKIRYYFKRFHNWIIKGSIIEDVKNLEPNPEIEIVDAHTLSKQTSENLKNNTFIKTICDKIYTESKKGNYFCHVKFDKKVPNNIISYLNRKGYDVYLKKYEEFYILKINW